MTRILGHAIIYIRKYIVSQKLLRVAIVTESTGTLMLLLQSLHNFHKCHRLGIQIESFEILILRVLQFVFNAFLDVVHVGCVVEIHAFDPRIIIANWVISFLRIDYLNAAIIFENHWISGTRALFTTK